MGQNWLLVFQGILCLILNKYIQLYTIKKININDTKNPSKKIGFFCKKSSLKFDK